MENKEKIKQIVRDKYGKIAEKAGSCCGDCCSEESSDYTVMSEDYGKIPGYESEADMGLGCGIPTEYAGINKGDLVLDLGSGAGNDVFVARRIVGAQGKVIGIDMTDEMIAKANKNLGKLQYENVEFRKGEIEKLPVNNNHVDVVISNCVLNLVPDKEKAFSEIFRTLKPGGHFCISDIVTQGDIPNELKENAELYAGCVAGAQKREEYLRIIDKIGFRDIEIKKDRKIEIPEEILGKFLDEKQRSVYDKSNIGIYSITVLARKPKA